MPGTEEKTAKRSEAKSIAEWINADFNSNFQGISSSGEDLTKKVNKVKHYEHLTTYSSFCYVVKCDPHGAHVSMMNDGYTLLSSDVKKAGLIISKMLEYKFSNPEPDPNNHYEVERYNAAYKKKFRDVDAEVGLFGGRLNDEIIEDYIGKGGLVDRCSHFIPVGYDNDKTVNYLNAVNNDKQLVSDFESMVKACNGDKGASALDSSQIIDILATVREIGLSAWEGIQKEKKENLGDRVKVADQLFYTRNDLLIKSGKVGALAAGGIYCIGSIAAGIYLPALALIPLWAVAKRWVPELATSLGSSMRTRFELRKLKRKEKQILASEYYLQHDGKVRFWDKVFGRISNEKKEQLDKQKKTFGDLYKKENSLGEIQNATQENINKYVSGESNVAADNLGNLSTELKGVESSIDELKKTENVEDPSTKMNKKNQSSLLILQNLRNNADRLKEYGKNIPNDPKRNELYSEFCEETKKLITDMMFNQEYGENLKGPIDDFVKDENVKEILKNNKDGGHLLKRLENISRFLGQEKVPIPIKGLAERVNLLSAPEAEVASGKSVKVHGLDLVGLTAFDEDTVKASYTKIPGITQSAEIDNLIHDMYSLKKDDGANFANMQNRIMTTVSDNQLKAYLLNRLQFKHLSTQLDSSKISSDIATEFPTMSALPPVDGESLIEALSNLKMITPTYNESGVFANQSDWGKIYGDVGGKKIWLDNINVAINTIADDNVKKYVINIRDGQLEKINNAFALTMKQKATKGIKDELINGTWVLYGANFKSDDGKDDIVINDAKMNYSEQGRKNASEFYYNNMSKLPSVTFKEDFLYYKLNNHMYLKFMSEVQGLHNEKADLTKVSEFLHNVDAAPYFTQAQKSFFENEMGKEAVLASARTRMNLATDPMGKGKEIISKAIAFQNSIADGGLRELAMVNPEFKDELDFYTDAAKMIDILAMPIKGRKSDYAWEPNELKFVSATLFKTQQVRKSGDFLFDFVTTIGQLPTTNFSNRNDGLFEIEQVMDSAGNPYLEIKGGTYRAIENLCVTLESINNVNPEDKQAAWLLLKHKVTSIYQNFMVQIQYAMQNNITSHRFSDALSDDANKQYIMDSKTAWLRLMQRIDSQALGKNSADLVGAYGFNPSSWEAMEAQPGMGQ